MPAPRLQCGVSPEPPTHRCKNDPDLLVEQDRAGASMMTGVARDRHALAPTCGPSAASSANRMRYEQACAALQLYPTAIDLVLLFQAANAAKPAKARQIDRCIASPSAAETKRRLRSTKCGPSCQPWLAHRRLSNRIRYNKTHASNVV